MTEQEAKLARLQDTWRRCGVLREPCTESHRKYYRDRGLTDNTIDAWETFSTKDGCYTSVLLDNKSCNGCGPASVVPIRNYSGEIVSLIARPDFPRNDTDGKKIKFEVPKGIPRPGLIPAPNSDQRLKASTTEYVIFTEGMTRTAVFDQEGKCAYGFSGVNGWNKKKTKILNNEIQARLTWIKKNGRVVIAFDSDARTNDNVLGEVKKLAAAFRKEGIVAVAVFPTEREIGEKLGWDDVIARNGIEVFDQAVAKALEQPEERPRISESDSHDLATWFLSDPNTPRLVRHGGVFWTWDSEKNHYSEIELEHLQNLFRGWANPRYSYITEGSVTQVLAQLREITAAPRGVAPPFWLGTVPDNFVDVDLHRECVFTRNLIVHLPRQLDGTRHTHPPTPGLFNTHALDIHWDPDAPRPQRFLKFLEESFSDDEPSKLRLQEIVGYLLTPDTSRQKIFMFVGAPGTGKGTVTRLFEILLGKNNVAPMTLRALGDSFGLQILVGKSLAVVSEVRLKERTNTNEALNVLLSISGEDDMLINRKNQPHIKARLSTRILMTCNEAPILPDSAGALKRRLVILSMNRVCQNPDKDLDKKLRSELAGILNWGFEGYEGLNRNGEFTELPIGVDEVPLVDQIVDAGAPIKSFVWDRCELGAGLEISVKDAHTLYQDWALSEGEHAVTKSRLPMTLKSAFPEITVTRVRAKDGSRPYVLRGITINEQWSHWITVKFETATGGY